MRVTYYLDVASSWCFWAEPMWAELKSRYAGRVEFGWKIAAMMTADYPSTPGQCDWFFRRSGLIMRSPSMLNSLDAMLADTAAYAAHAAHFGSSSAP